MYSSNGKNFIDFYALLEVSRAASSKEIQEACLRLGESLRSESDSGENSHAAHRLSLVEEAYETLTISENRAAYDRKLDEHNRSSSAPIPESAPPPHKREGILVMAGSIAGAAIVITTAVIMIGPTHLGIASIVGLTTFRLVPYESRSEYTGTTLYLSVIELDATIVLLLCFLVGLYGLLVFLAVLPRPSVLWRRLAQIWSR